MIKKFSIFIFLLYNSLCFGQRQQVDSLMIQKHITNSKGSFVNLDYFKKKYNRPLTAKDSANFFIRNNDTLVFVEDFKQPEGVQVPYEFKDSTFLHHYKKVAFNYWTDSLRPKARMRYWKEDIKIFFSKSISGKPKRELKRFAKDIDQLVDSLTISIVNKVEDSNYIIYAQGDFEYESRLANKNYSDFYLFWNKKSQIYKCALKINKEHYFNEELLTIGLKKNFFQTLGHFKFSDELACNNYFSNCFSKNKQLTILDKELLTYHYSYGICKGTSLADFEKQHEKMKKQLKKNPNAKLYFFHSK